MKKHRRNMGPHEYFTAERLRARTREKLPPVLFHFTQYDLALKILRDGILRGRPTLSTTENPGLHFTPGPIAFALNPQLILKAGFTLWPYLWMREYREAEWVVASKDAEWYAEANHLHSRRVEVPVWGLVRMVGYPESWTTASARPRPEMVKRLRDAARKWSISVHIFNWPDWWKDGVVPARRNP